MQSLNKATRDELPSPCIEVASLQFNNLYTFLRNKIILWLVRGLHRWKLALYYNRNLSNLVLWYVNFRSHISCPVSGDHMHIFPRVCAISRDVFDTTTIHKVIRIREVYLKY